MSRERGVKRLSSRSYPRIPVEGWSHYDLYDKPEPVGEALARLIPFYKEHLGRNKIAEKIA